jgi:tetratricopeptide (TPR) repeat protein
LKGIHKITIGILVVLVLAACSRKKNTFMSRNYHAVTAEYNALYNGGIAFEAGKQQLAQTYKDNFWEILPVERIDLDEDDFGAPGVGPQQNENFTRAEEKAAKAIQKHSVYVKGKEYNPQIDEAYILLGKARYFDKRFIPAIDAFNFILNKYPTSNNINRAKVWKAKTNIRLNSEDVALENLQKILDQEDNDISKEDLVDVTAIMAQAYIKLDSLEEALPYIKIASENVKDNELKGRYAYIKGQLYNRLGFKDSANLAFDEVIELNRKSPRIYMINAYIAKAKNFDYEKGDKTLFLELLTDLAENRENRPYLDKIYNQIGEYYLNAKPVDTAIAFYNRSIKNYKGDKYLQAVNYTTLGEINFDRREYKTAGAYYDSTLTQLEEGTREYRRVTKKRENLDDVIKYEDIALLHDSILRFATMTEAQQLAYFTEYTSKLKAKAVEDSIANAAKQETIQNNEFYKKEIGSKEEKEAKGGTFYFYNPTTVAYGKQQFQQIWGNRKLEDNWRRSDKQSSGINDENTDAVVAISDNEKFDPQAYISKIPTDQKVIDSLKKDRDFAYYQLGLIYKEKFKEYDLAVNRLEKLLTFNPEERLVLPAKYNLYKISTIREDNTMASKYKNDILNNHPDSRYAEILRNPNTQLATDESSPEFKYKELYKEFEASKYQKVINESDNYITIYTGTDMVPKFELLKATAIARKEGFEAYKKALNYVSLNYPNSDEGKQAQRIYSTVLPTLENKEFIDPAETDSWKVVYSFTSQENEAANLVKAKIDSAITKLNYRDLKVSLDYYSPDNQFVVVHGLDTQLGGRGFAQVLRERKEYKIQRSFFEIATPNYKIIQLHKNLDAYLKSIRPEEEETEPQK